MPNYYRRSFNTIFLLCINPVCLYFNEENKVNEVLEICFDNINFYQNIYEFVKELHL